MKKLRVTRMLERASNPVDSLNVREEKVQSPTILHFFVLFFLQNLELTDIYDNLCIANLKNIKTYKTYKIRFRGNTQCDQLCRYTDRYG